MDKQQKITFAILIAIGIFFFCLMIPTNWTGSEDAAMLSIFEVDEFAQYPHLIRMLAPGETFYQSIRNFFVYEHYFYGFPFYLSSALAVMPLRWLGGTDWTTRTRLIVCVLRQMVSVLPMLLALGLLTWIFTHFRKRWLAIGLFLFLNLAPAVWVNHFWWHPDSLSFLFVCLTLFFLTHDNLRFGKFFYLAAATCGYAIGIKYHGLYFALATPTLLLYAAMTKQKAWSNVFRAGILFFVVLGIGFLLSNPLFLLPQERAEIIRVQQLQFQQTGTGTFTKITTQPETACQVPSIVKNHYGDHWLFLLGFGGILISGFQSHQNRTRALIFLPYLLVAAAVTFHAAASRLHYLLPLALPILAGIAGWFEAAPRKKNSSSIAKIAVGLLITIQLALYIRQDIAIYQQQLARETESPAITLYQTMKAEWLPTLQTQVKSENRMVRILKDWKIYFPSNANTVVQFDWDMLTAEKVKEFHPDWIVLEQANIKEFGQPEIISAAIDPEKMSKIQNFYQSAKQDCIHGYHQIFENSFAIVFAHD